MSQIGLYRKSIHHRPRTKPEFIDYPHVFAFCRFIDQNMLGSQSVFEVQNQFSTVEYR